MSWDIRRLALAIETAALYIACAWLVTAGYWRTALAAMIIKTVDGVLMARDWRKHGEPRTTHNEYL